MLSNNADFSGGSYVACCSSAGANGSAGGVGVASDEIDGGGFACAVGAEEGDDFSAVDAEVEVVNGGNVLWTVATCVAMGKGFSDIRKLNCRGSGHILYFTLLREGWAESTVIVWG